MSLLFCTSCGHNMALDSMFCAHCGQALIVSNISSLPPNSTTRNSLLSPIAKARSVISQWVMPINATLFFGGTLASVLDFISPRISLLPIAATVALAGLFAAVCLRKFIAPSLPDTSKLKGLLAPDKALHRSPVLIVSGVLSALMVTGAAWSSASSAGGGVIASKFDAVRNAQMQLGVMQGLQKEQRIQTAVLEDIRDGRTSNPRRELANQGIAWDYSGFNNAISRSDTAVVQLFLSGGWPWKLRSVEYMAEGDAQKTMALLLQYPTLLVRDDEGDCWSSTLQMTRAKVDYFRKTQLKYQPQPAPVLTATDKGFLKLFCRTAKDFSHLKKELNLMSESFHKRLQERLAITDSVGISPAPGTYRTNAECKRDLLANNARFLLERAHTFVAHSQGCGPIPCYGYAIASDDLLHQVKAKNPRGASQLTAQTMPDVDEYCEGPNGQQAPFDDFEVQILKQIIDSVN